MLKLIKYLKPFALSVILIFLLLFAQAQTDLALPDYMANIVNIGLQRGVSPMRFRQRSGHQSWTSCCCS